WLTLNGAVPVTDDGLTLTPGVVRRLACDADLIPVVLGTRSEVLDVGRTHRLVTGPLWRALVCRDRHCAFPGCTRPPVMCHAHHIRHWLHGGETALTNLVLLCGHHHRTIHHTPWEVRLHAGDGRPEFLPPPRRGSTPTWIRHRPRRE
ncbi:MAG TPA: HNH endonuclease, partial [Nocardioides sp.]|nr:HNH endonuclease [Nocardioides sp.]